MKLKHSAQKVQGSNWEHWEPLRCVMPWYDSDQQLIGYIELGMEIDGIFATIERLYSTHIFMLIKKNIWIKAAGSKECKCSAM